MALIIKGDMPTCCWDCDRDWETNCPLSASNEVYEEWKDVENEVRHPDCPIIGEIPDKHGDLIDRKALSDAIGKVITDRDRMIGTYDTIEQIIDDAETIVEATE